MVFDTILQIPQDLVFIGELKHGVYRDECDDLTEAEINAFFGFEVNGEPMESDDPDSDNSLEEGQESDEEDNDNITDLSSHSSSEDMSTNLPVIDHESGVSGFDTRVSTRTSRSIAHSQLRRGIR